jgi:hypothetical protein
MEEFFEALTEQLTTVPIQTHNKPTTTCIVKTDVADFVLGAILSQNDQDGQLYPIPFHSPKFNPAKINYEVHEQELLAIVDSFKVWRQYQKGTLQTVMVYSDHENIEYFTKTKVLNQRQAGWAQ